MVNWYLKEIESEIDSEEELINRKGLIEKVIHRLVHYVSQLLTILKAFPNLVVFTLVSGCMTLISVLFFYPLPRQDHILIELSQAGLRGSESESSDGDSVLVVNPNYILED